MADTQDPTRLAAMRRLPRLDSDAPALARALHLAARILNAPHPQAGPRLVPLGDADLEALQDLAAMAMMAIELRRQVRERELAPAEPAAASDVPQIANGPVERSGEATSSALSMLRHELGQPLTVIQGFSELICGGDLSSEDVKEYAAEIFKEATHLAEMVARTRDLERAGGEAIPSPHAR